MDKVKLSRHATERILSRTGDRDTVKQITMTPDEVLDFLNAGVFVPTKKRPVVGEKANLKFLYWLFFSPKDNAFFVAIGINDNYGGIEIVTVIPLNNAEKWGVTGDKKIKARMLACNYINFVPINFKQRNSDNKTNQNTDVLKVSCSYINHEGRNVIKRLGKIDLKDLNIGIDDLVKTKEFMESCIEIAGLKEVKKNSITNIIVKRKDKDVPIVIEVN